MCTGLNFPKIFWETWNFENFTSKNRQERKWPNCIRVYWKVLQLSKFLTNKKNTQIKVLLSYNSRSVQGSYHIGTFAWKKSHFTIKTGPNLWVVSKSLENLLQQCISVRYCDQAAERKIISKLGKLPFYGCFLNISQSQLPGCS